MGTHDELRQAWDRARIAARDAERAENRAWDKRGNPAVADPLATIGARRCAHAALDAAHAAWRAHPEYRFGRAVVEALKAEV